MVRRVIWYTSKYTYYLEPAEDGVIYKEPSDPNLSYLDIYFLGKEGEKLIEELAKLGYRPLGLRVPNFLDSMIGHSWSDLLKEAKLRAEKNAVERRRHAVYRAKEKQKTILLREQFGNNILGLDKQYLRIFPAGFAVRVWMNAGSVEKNKRYADENRLKILSWCIEEIGDNPKFMKEIGSLNYYTPTKIIILQTSEMEIIFEVKDTPLVET